jgi:hypothetical protein
LNFFGGVNERFLGMEICLFTLAQWLYNSFNVIYGYPEVKAKTLYPSNGSHNCSSKPLMQWNGLTTIIIPIFIHKERKALTFFIQEVKGAGVTESLGK